MRRLFLPLIAALALCPVAAQAQAPACVPVRIPEARAPIRIDGDLREWPRGPGHAIVSAAPDAARNTAHVQFAWDAHALYAAFRVRDTRLTVVPRDRLPLPDLFRADSAVGGAVAFPADPLGMLYMSDSVELYLTADTAASAHLRPQDFQVIVDVRGAVGVLRGDAMIARIAPDWDSPKIVDRTVRVTAAVRLDGTLNLDDDRDGGYTAEIALPWSSLRLDGPPPGGGVRVLAAVNDNEAPLPPGDSNDAYYPANMCGGFDYGPPRTWAHATLVPGAADTAPWAAAAVLVGLLLAAGAYRLRRARAEAVGAPLVAVPDAAPPTSAPLAPDAPAPEASAEARWLARVDAAAAQGIGQSGFGVEALAGEVGVSARQMQRRLQALTGLTPAEYLRQRRLESAARLLAARAGTVSEVAARVGLDPASLSRLFRQHYGVSPSAWPPAP